MSGKPQGSWPIYWWPRERWTRPLSTMLFSVRPPGRNTRPGANSHRLGVSRAGKIDEAEKAFDEVLVIQLSGDDTPKVLATIGKARCLAEKDKRNKPWP